MGNGDVGWGDLEERGGEAPVHDCGCEIHGCEGETVVREVSQWIGLVWGLWNGVRDGE